MIEPAVAVLILLAVALLGVLVGLSLSTPRTPREVLLLAIALVIAGAGTVAIVSSSRRRGATPPAVPACNPDPRSDLVAPLDEGLDRARWRAARDEQGG